MPDEVKVKLNVETIAAGISIAMGLVKSGIEIYEMLDNKDELTVEDYLALIERENEEQEAARAKFKKLIDDLKKEGAIEAP